MQLQHCVFHTEKPISPSMLALRNLIKYHIAATMQAPTCIVTCRLNYYVTVFQFLLNMYSTLCKFNVFT